MSSCGEFVHSIRPRIFTREEVLEYERKLIDSMKNSSGKLIGLCFGDIKESEFESNEEDHFLG